MARTTRETSRSAIARPLAAIGTEVAALAVLASIAFFIEMMVRWALR